METKKSMDPSQVAMLCTECEQIYQAERTKGDFFSADSDPDKKGTGVVKEPTPAVCAVGTYPLRYMLDFLKLGKANKTTHVKLELGRENTPIRMEFLSRDNLNLENGTPKLEKTYIWIAPRVSNDDEPEMTKEQLEAKIKIHENEIVLLKNKLPKEEKAL